MIYLDSAATALKKPPGVIYAMKRAMDTASSPGRGGHGYAMRAAEIVYDARELAARLFNAPDPENVVFTFNATHGLNIAINSILPEGGKALKGRNHLHRGRNPPDRSYLIILKEGQ